MIRECGAKTRASAISKYCKRIAMPNRRCHLHGGKSTGAKTKAGKLRQKMASWKHGYRSKETLEQIKFLKGLLKSCDNMIAENTDFKILEY